MVCWQLSLWFVFNEYHHYPLLPSSLVSLQLVDAVHPLSISIQLSAGNIFSLRWTCFDVKILSRNFGFDIVQVASWILSQRWTVGDLWNMLIEYSTKRSKGETTVGFLRWLLPSLYGHGARFNSSNSP